MADTTQESVIFELKLNAEQYRSEQKLIRDSLGQLVLDIDKTKAAQKELQKAREAGKVSDADYSRQTVALREQLKGQQADYRDLSKGLENSQRVMQSGAGSIVQLRARLSELTTEWNNLTAAERDNSEEGKRLQAEARAVSDELKKQEGLIGDNRRNVGGYAQAFKQGLVGIVAELAKVTAAQKGVDAATEQGQRLQQQRIGFQTAAQRAAAQAGITDFAQAQATIEQYAQALAPAAENLVRLQQEQQQVGQTAGEASQEYQQLGFRVAGAEKELTDLVAAQQAAGQASQAGGAAAQQQGQAVQVAANSLAGLRQRLAQLKEQREALDPTTQEAKELNEEILRLDTSIQQAAGKIDAFGERVQKNIKKENFDTVSDAIQGLSGATAVATLVFGDNANAAAAQAKAMQLMTIAQSARSIAIGLDSAKDAAQIILLKAKSLLFKQQATTTAADTVSTGAHAAATATDTAALEAQAGAAALAAEAQVAGTEAAVAGTVAAGAQAATTGGLTVATEAATVAAEGFAAAFALTGIGTVLVLLAALAGALFFYSKASDSTKEKINRFVEVLFRFGTPIGLLLTGLGKLYDKVEFVRKAVAPLIAGFQALGHFIGENARELGEWIGVLDTADERAAKFAAAQLERGQALREQADAEVKAIELAGATATEVTQARVKNIDDLVTKQREANRTADAIHQRELTRIRAQLAAGEELSDADKKLYEERQKGETALINLLNERQALINEGIERERASRQQQLSDIEGDTQRAIASYRRRLDEGIANEKATLQNRLSLLDRGLAIVRRNSEEELELQRKKILAQRDLELLNLGPTLAQERALRRKFLGEQLKELTESKKTELEKHGLTEQEKAHIELIYRNKAADARLSFSTTEAQREVQQRQQIDTDAAAASLALTTAHLRQQTQAALQAQHDQTTAKLTNVQQVLATEAGLREQADETRLQQAYTLQRRQIILERELALASLDVRQDTAAQELRIRAEANRKLAELDMGQADATRQRRAQQLSEEARGYDLLAEGMLAGLNQTEQQQVQASETYKQQRLAAVQAEQEARLAVVTKGSQEEANIRQEAATKIRQIQADGAQAQLVLYKAQAEQVAAVVLGSLSSLSAIQDADSQAKLARIQREMDAEGVSAARKAVLEKQKLRVEQQAAEQRKRLARVQAVVQLAQGVLNIIAAPSLLPSPAGEILKAVEIAAATATAYAQFRALDSAKYAAGGVLRGPSHAQGGIPLFSRHTGRALGAEAEGGEIILTKGVFRNPFLRAAASALNVAGGGRPFFQDHLEGSALMLRLAEGGVVPRNLPDYLPQVLTGGVVMHTPPIDYDRLAAALAAQPTNYEALADILAARLTSAFVAGARALPPQEVSLTELRARQQQLEDFERQTHT